MATFNFIITNSSIEGFDMIAIKNDYPIKRVEFRKPLYLSDDCPDSVNRFFENIIDDNSYKELSYDEAKSTALAWEKYKDCEVSNPGYVSKLYGGKEIKTFSHFKNIVKQ